MNFQFSFLGMRTKGAPVASVVWGLGGCFFLFFSFFCFYFSQNVRDWKGLGKII